MPDYDRARIEFSRARERDALAGLPGGGIKIAYEAVDRQADGPLAGTVAMRFLGRRGQVRNPTYADRKRDTARFANVLRALGAEPASASTRASRANSRAVHRGARGAEAWRCLLAAVLGVRAGG